MSSRPWTPQEISVMFQAFAAKHERDGICTPCTWYLPIEGNLTFRDHYPWHTTIFPLGQRVVAIQSPCAFSHMARIVKAPFN